MGLYNDFTMRASIPSLFIIMICCLDKINRMTIRNIFKINNILLILVLLIGFYQSFLIDFYRHSVKDEDFSVLGEENYYPTMEWFSNRSIKDDGANSDLKYNYYSYDLDNYIFYKYITRRR